MMIDTIIYKLCKLLLRVFRKDKDEKCVQSVVQFVKFAIVGASNTIVAYLLYVGVLLAMRPLNVSWDFIVGNIVSFVLSVLWSFYWNNKFVFKLEEGESRSLGKTLMKTYVTYGFSGIILSNILSWIWISIFDISKYIAPIINLLVSVPINFLMNKFWAYKKKR